MDRSQGRSSKHTFEGLDVMLEGRSAFAEELRQRGHKVEMRGDFSSMMGGGQAVMRDSASGVNRGASDLRKDGAAIPEP
jgi:gamma-glutamyltranspeptidase/glutathione hydrolase